MTDASYYTIVCKACLTDLVSGKSIVKVKHHHVVDDVTIRDRVTLQPMPDDKKKSFLEEDYLSKISFTDSYVLYIQ